MRNWLRPLTNLVPALPRAERDYPPIAVAAIARVPAAVEENRGTDPATPATPVTQAMVAARVLKYSAFVSNAIRDASRDLYPVVIDDKSATDNSIAEQSDSSTLATARIKSVEKHIAALFNVAKGERFEDGMESEFSRGLASCVARLENSALVELADLIVFERVNPELASECLRWLGRIDHARTYRYRRWLLEKGLTHSSPLVRDGAALGLVSLDDPHAIPYLAAAIEHEPCNELRQDLTSALQQLENVRPCHSS